MSGDDIYKGVWVGGIFEYDNAVYKVTDIIKLKHPTTRKWVNAVAYESEFAPYIFVRELDEFVLRFKEVKK